MGSCAGSPAPVRRDRGSSRLPAGRCSRRRLPSFWGEVLRSLGAARRPGARTPPADAFLAQDAAHLAASDLDTSCLRRRRQGSSDHSEVSPPCGCAGASVPSSQVTSRPGGGLAAKAMRTLRSASLRRAVRPLPGCMPSPSSPRAPKAWKRSRTVCGWQPSSSAMIRVRTPSQLRRSCGHAPPNRRGHADSGPSGAPGVLPRHRRAGELQVIWGAAGVSPSSASTPTRA